MPSPFARRTLLPFATTLLIAALVRVQPAAAQESPTYVDDTGVLRWSDSNEEIALFGVNYSTPFAFGYRAHQYIGADHKASIDADVAHFARLGLDAFRVHVWEREISDSEGNLVENEHLDLLDYLLASLQERGIKTILTPIAWWPPGYPEPDPVSPGFTQGYSKGETTTDPVARAAAVNYVKQFISHENPYTEKTYRDDPEIIAIEIFNEPNHPGGPRATTDFIDALANALREEGLQKPIFYNISEGYTDEHGHAVCAAEIDGISVQWYPTGLVRNRSLHGNMLPNVDRYPLPFADFPECHDKARMVYEFDAADVAGSYMYPAMARSFRGAGFQWATQFAYDPMAIAWSNTEYQTHYLNLVYTPSKAISFMIAGEAFRHVPRGENYGTYPESGRFGPFHLSYENDLSEMVTDSSFYYSNDTSTRPPDAIALRRIAGVGSSPIVQYDGTGAYFLDRIADGVWRLEVYPDAAAVEDPFGRSSLRRHAVRLAFLPRAMYIDLPDLGREFVLEPLNQGNEYRANAVEGAITVGPGVYLLSRDDVMDVRGVANTAYGDHLGEYFVPSRRDFPTTVVHTPAHSQLLDKPFVIEANVVSSMPVDSVALFLSSSAGGWAQLTRMEASGGFTYRVEVPAERLQLGLAMYRIVVYEDGEATTYPGPAEGHPYEWDFTDTESWTVPVVPDHSPHILFDARRDRDELLYPSYQAYVPFQTGITAGTLPDRSALHVEIQDLSVATRHFGIRSSPARPHRPVLEDVPEDAFLRITARSLDDRTDSLEVALVLDDGTAWGSTISIQDSWRQIDLPLSSLKRVPLALLPRPYPLFLPYLFMSASDAEAPDLRRLEGLQFSLGASQVDDPAAPHGFEVERVELRQ